MEPTLRSISAAEITNVMGDRLDRDHGRLLDDVQQVAVREEAVVVQRQREHDEDRREDEIDDVEAPVEGAQPGRHAASCSSSSSAASPATSRWSTLRTTAPSRTIRIRSAAASSSGVSDETRTIALPWSASARIICRISVFVPT